MLSTLYNRIYNGFIDFILPGVCIHCEEVIENAPNTGGKNPEAVKFICAKCYGRLERYNDEHPWKSEAVSAGIIDDSLSAFWFREGNEIQSLIHNLKYNKMRSAGRLLGREMGRRILTQDKAQWDYIIPVPLYKSRLRDRTFNQSTFIAKGISEITKAEVLDKAIKRVRFTGTQTKLNKAERKENIKDAFVINGKYASLLKGKNILVADDVITTGATILECASALKPAGTGKIWVCSAAYAELKFTGR